MSTSTDPHAAPSGPQTAAANKGPLAGLTVIELGVLLAGPFCGQLLADYGAEVIKIEAPGVGDPLREWGQVKADGHPLWFSLVARNKRCATLDLRKPEGQAALKTLVAKADILLENFRPGTMEKWGLGPDALHALNPGLIYLRVSGYGQTGPYAQKAGYASVGEAFGGLRYVMGEPDRAPSRAGISIGDTLAASYACMGALAALEARRKTGRGQVVDSSIYESVLAMMESLIPEYQLAGYIRERSGSVLANVAPSNIYAASDGMVIIAANQDNVFKRLCAMMGAPELADLPKYAGHHGRGAHQAELDGIVTEWTKVRTRDEIQAACDEAGVPCGPIYRAPEMLEDPHFAARESIVDVPHPHFGSIKMQNVAPKFSDTPCEIRWSGRALGEDNEYVWRDRAGLSQDQFETLKAAKII
ncbi:MAG: CaiB/BaiF CoA transferase family protein [Caulobacterales bacterium]|jgi:crotonobetainyl-CoA:carnitine CoA-transferase CaiB-like acyl-CoA transferase